MNTYLFVLLGAALAADALLLWIVIKLEGHEKRLEETLELTRSDHEEARRRWAGVITDQQATIHELNMKMLEQAERFAQRLVTMRKDGFEAGGTEYTENLEQRDPLPPEIESLIAQYDPSMVAHMRETAQGWLDQGMPMTEVYTRLEKGSELPDELEEALSL